METLEFIIYPDGRVLEKVTGIVGSSCQEVTSAIEERLGVVVARERTSEYYHQTVDRLATVTNEATSGDR